MSLEIYVGPMFSGKTTKLIHMYIANKHSNKIIIDYDLQEKKGKVEVGNIINHNQYELSGAYKACAFRDLKNEDAFDSNQEYRDFLTAKHIYINECQFFPDLKDFVMSRLNTNANVYLYGLNGDYKQQQFGQTFELIPYCSHIETIKGMCKTCNSHAIVSYRTVQNTDLYLTDSTCYIPLCLQCFSSTTSHE